MEIEVNREKIWISKDLLFNGRWSEPSYHNKGTQNHSVSSTIIGSDKAVFFHAFKTSIWGELNADTNIGCLTNTNICTLIKDEEQILLVKELTITLLFISVRCSITIKKNPSGYTYWENAESTKLDTCFPFLRC